MNVTERKSLLDSRDNTILSAVVKANDLKQQLLADQLKKLPEALCTNNQLLKTPVSCLYVAFHSLSRSRFPSSTRLDSTYLRLIHRPCSSVRVSTKVLIKHLVSERKYPRKYENTFRAHIH